jgi:hypothetical protein
MEFPVEKSIHNGKEYLNMKSDVFHSFFLELMKYTDTEGSLIKEINKRYEKAKRIKRKRIGLKKEKEVLTVMYNIMFDKFIK